MSKRRLGLVLSFGLALAIFVSACGVALGPVQFTAGGPAVMEPGIAGWQTLIGTPARQPATVHAMWHLQYFAAPQLSLTVPAIEAHHCQDLP